MLLRLLRWLFGGGRDPDDLARVLRKAISDPDLRPHFYMMFLQSEVAFISNSFEEMGIDSEVEFTLKAGESIGIKQYYDSKNQLFIPVFSSLEVLQYHIEDSEYYVIMKGVDFLQLIRGQSVILNPGEKYFKEFTADEIEDLIQMAVGSEQVSAIAPSQDISLSQPEHMPEELLGTLTEFFQEQDDISAAYFTMFQDNESKEESHPLIVVDLKEGREDLIYEIAELARPYSQQGMMIDFTILDKEDKEFYQYFDSIGPFYERNDRSMTRH